MTELCSEVAKIMFEPNISDALPKVHNFTMDSLNNNAARSHFFEHLL